MSALRSGTLSLDFLDGAAYERFAALADETFQEVSDRTGVPLELRHPDTNQSGWSRTRNG